MPTKRPRIGLVSETVPPADLLERCYEIGTRIAAFSRPGTELTKRMLWAGLEASSYAAHMRSEMNAQLLVRMTTRNFEEAVLARSENRPTGLRGLTPYRESDGFAYIFFGDRCPNRCFTEDEHTLPLPPQVRDLDAGASSALHRGDSHLLPSRADALTQEGDQDQPQTQRSGVGAVAKRLKHEEQATDSVSADGTTATVLEFCTCETEG